MCPQTTSQITACDAVIKLQNVEGTLLDMSGSSNSVTMRFLQPTGQLRTFGTRFYIRGQCGQDAELSMRAVYSEDDDEALNCIRDWYFNYPGTTRAFEVYLPDAAAGSDKYAFTVLLEDFEIPAESGNADPVLCAVTLKPTGTFSWTKVAS